MRDYVIDLFRLPIRLAVWLVALAFLSFSGLALAADATLTWQPPTEYTDGSPLPAVDLRETVVQWLTCDGTWPADGAPQSVSVPAPASSAVIAVPPGRTCFRAAVVTVLGAQSDWSSTAVKVVPAPTPNPPTIIEIDIRATATLEPTSDGGLRLTVR